LRLALQQRHGGAAAAALELGRTSTSTTSWR
jgi:hypothetical protein